MKTNKNYDERCHSIGRWTIWIALFGMTLFPLVMILILKVPADWKVLATACVSILMIQIPSALSQFLSYAPVVGPSAMYMMVVTGNFSNMKIPAVISAKEAIGMDQADQSPESDVISTIAMASSTIVSEVIIILGVLLMSQLSGLLANPVLRPAFANISPAVFGALFMVLVVKTPKLAVAPVIAAVLLMVFTKIPSALMMPICLIIALIATKLMYDNGMLASKGAKKKESEGSDV
jgi:hypothetical protein